MSEFKMFELSAEDIQVVSVSDLRLRTLCYLNRAIEEYQKWLFEIKPGTSFRDGAFLMYESRKGRLFEDLALVHSIGLLPVGRYDEIFDMISINHKYVLDIMLSGGGSDA